MEQNLTGKIAIITGGSRGIGRNIVEHLTQRGAAVLFTYNTRQEEAEQLVRSVTATGGKAAALRLSVGDMHTFDRFVEDARPVLRQLGAERFDFLINNAGNSNHTPFAQTSEQEMDELYNIHFKGPFFLTQKLLPHINDGGRILMISTGLTRMTFPGSQTYAAMKSAVETLTRYLAKELGPRRIRVNCVAPGAVQTDFSGGVVRDNPEVNKMVSAATALGRPGLPEDIGPMVASLLSEDNRWINAQRIEVSGGMAL